MSNPGELMTAESMLEMSRPFGVAEIATTYEAMAPTDIYNALAEEFVRLRAGNRSQRTARGINVGENQERASAKVASDSRVERMVTGNNQRPVWEVGVHNMLTLVRPYLLGEDESHDMAVRQTAVLETVELGYRKDLSSLVRASIEQERLSTGETAKTHFGWVYITGNTAPELIVDTRKSPLKKEEKLILGLGVESMKHLERHQHRGPLRLITPSPVATA